MSIFTKRHYVWLANVARKAVGDHHSCDACDLIYRLADALQDESPAFNRARFLRAIYDGWQQDTPRPGRRRGGVVARSNPN